MRVLFDTNVILDVLLAHTPHVGPATALLDRVAAKDVDGLLGATTVTTIHYLATKAVGAAMTTTMLNSARPLMRPPVHLESR